MRSAITLFLIGCSINTFAGEVCPIPIKVGDASLESFSNLLVNGIKKDCTNIQEQMHSGSGIFFFSNPIIIETQKSAYKVSSFKAERPEFSNGWGGDGQFVGFSPLKDRSQLISALKGAREEMINGKNNGVVRHGQLNTIELHHPMGRIILFLSTATGTSDPNQLDYNPQSDRRLLDF